MYVCILREKRKIMSETTTTKINTRVSMTDELSLNYINVKLSNLGPIPRKFSSHHQPQLLMDDIDNSATTDIDKVLAAQTSGVVTPTSLPLFSNKDTICNANNILNSNPDNLKISNILNNGYTSILKHNQLTSEFNSVPSIIYR